jgi:hypothetical protein
MITRTAVAALVAVTLAGCSGEVDARTHRDATSSSIRTTVPSTPPSTAATVSELPTFTEGVGLSEWLSYRDVNVRVLDYQVGPAPTSGSGERVDQLQVEECAPASGPVTVTHQDWALADASDVTLGLAGGKFVGGSPTEDPPLSLDAGECATTLLAVGVPVESVAVFAHDGPDTRWVL